MRQQLFLGIGLLILVGCGQTKAPLRLVSTSVPQAVIMQNTPRPTSIPPAATPLVGSVGAVSNLRADPSTNADIITTVDAQAAIIIIAQQNSADQLWYQVRVNDYQGWMHASLFKLSAQQQALLPWEQAMVAPSPTILPTQRPYATQRPAISRPRATAKPSRPSRPAATSRPTKPKPPTTSKPRPRR
ncbi:MAG TPA: hypothetical protein DEF47_00360 [Herpetosiphon sp.]|uniref:SH3 type 3 domain protein n=1 Tax=Herpetosiphon aurantiacus (strain ATCC 23779 / DSM 785 / 114-95) TaxID=316274 RepID=A9B4K1_HERA2|nr:SH3 domain-containing protein [Herpetosiphon sp.]ABX04166.1 SH3 type 3 domain protein [Herpetosiphon aurantiacus DSM 785]HBW48341.1 hypothetical protein [Herpetosiphon sp.]